MGYIDVQRVLKKPFVGAKEIAVLADCSESTAQKIKKQIILKEITPTGLKLCPKAKIATKLLIDHLRLDEDYINQMAEKEKRLSVES